MSVAGNHSVNHHFLPNGRKRKLSPCSVSPHDKRQTKLKFTSEKRIRVSQEVPDTLNSELSASEMEQTVSPTESNHKKLPFANSFATKASLNNHKKPGQGKKLVIKNRKGELLELGREVGIGSPASHTLHRERKYLVTLQPLSCYHSGNLM